jgi:hypothetical protein
VVHARRLPRLQTRNRPRTAHPASARFQPLEPQSGLKPIVLPGDPPIELDPYEHDLIRALVEQRARIKHERDNVTAAGDDERARQLDALQLGLKIAANAIAYGSPIELNSIEHRRPIATQVFRPDRSSYRTRVRPSEEPGRWFHPLLATLVAAGGRLLLAAAIASFREHGGCYATCDTDSLFIVATQDGKPAALAPGNAIPTLSWGQIEAVRRKFEPLNPYDKNLIPGSILELEPENYHPDTGNLREIYCLSLAAKRYALFQLDEKGRPQIVGRPGKRKRSEHGLGHLLPPQNLDQETFYDQWWQQLIQHELGIAGPDPDWFDDIAAGRLTITSPHTEAVFRDFNRELPYPERVKPWNSVSVVHVARLARGKRGPRFLIAPYQPDSSKLDTAEWIDPNDRARRSNRIAPDGKLNSGDGAIPVQTYHDYFHEYRLHREAKALAPDGKPCHPWTRGPLQPPLVHATKLARIGKESQPLTDGGGLILEQDDPTLEYPEPRCQACRRPLRGRQRYWCGDACRKRANRALGAN